MITVQRMRKKMSANLLCLHDYICFFRTFWLGLGEYLSTHVYVVH